MAPALAGRTKEDVLAKYGNAAEAPSDEVRALAASEAYVEYDAAGERCRRRQDRRRRRHACAAAARAAPPPTPRRSATPPGRVIKGQEVRAKSRYEEDVLVNNHTAVWGSYWADGAWGYACCRQTIKNSYCTGGVGGDAAADAAAQLAANVEAKAAEAEERARAAAAAAEGKRPLEGVRPSAGLWGSEVEEGLQLDPAKLKAALAKHLAAREAGDQAVDDRKRGYNSLRGDDVEVTAEDMEAYRLTKDRGDDPLTFIKRQKKGHDGSEGSEGGDGKGTAGYDYV